MKIIISERQQKLIKENSIRDSLIDMIKDDGWNSISEMVGGYENLKKLSGINSPMDFLHLFDDLNIVQSQEKSDWTLFRYKPNYNLMVYDRKKRYVFINYIEIWKVLDEVFNLNDTEIQELTKEWLSEVYNLRGVTPNPKYRLYDLKLSEVYNLRGVTPEDGKVFT